MTSLEQTADCLIQFKFILLVGPTGSGKTTLAMILAEKLGLKMVHNVAFHSQSTIDDVIGTYLIRGSSTEWEDGPVPLAIRNRGMALLEECEYLQNNSCFSFIYSLCDERHQLSLPTGEVLKTPEEFRLILCTNSTERLPMALLNRMDYVVQLNYLEPSTEATLLMERIGISSNTANTLTKIAEISRKTLKQGISTRTLLKFGQQFDNVSSTKQADCLQQILLSSFAMQSERDAVWAAVTLTGIIPSITKPTRKRGC